MLISTSTSRKKKSGNIAKNKPVVIISQCLEFDTCRYDGKCIKSKWVRELAPYVTFHPVCPEMQIGLGVPRLPLRLIKKGSQKKLIQLETKKDLTSRIKLFSSSFLQSLKEADGFLLKSRSPSCGLNDTKIYSSLEAKKPLSTSERGIFAEEVLKKFPHLAVSDEEKIKKSSFRKAFLKKLFLLSSFRKVKSKKDLFSFHQEASSFLKEKNPRLSLKMEKILTPKKPVPYKKILLQYSRLLQKILTS